MSLDTPRTEPRRSELLTPHEARQRLEHERNSRLTQLHAVEEGGQNAEQQVMAAQKDTIRRVLTEIDAAFGRIEDGTYGVCQGCPKPIPVERLEILPYTRFCVPCLRDAV
ncbi:TraR/DksA family transcriptional regulator [Streptomyces fructofermentans]|uniref:Molecular chaperone DnaK n=1 Tax=Streptomyces fructofermentans TaxID=152141 RepID=A0A918KAU2_9ACTN|nr:TraR/DksA C4-type zinc finger protein [Streptomyces fructofermentans]GGX56323.1 molecular chaperone DnaK [Streptomyces fructofermentans]